HVAVHLGEGGQIGLEEGVRLLDGHAQVLAQRVCALAVHDAEVDGLAGGTQLRGDFTFGNMVNFGGGRTVDVRAVAEGLLHGLVPGDVGQDAQFDLGIEIGRAHV